MCENINVYAASLISVSYVFTSGVFNLGKLSQIKYFTQREMLLWCISFYLVIVKNSI